MKNVQRRLQLTPHGVCRIKKTGAGITGVGLQSKGDFEEWYFGYLHEYHVSTKLECRPRFLFYVAALETVYREF